MKGESIGFRPPPPDDLAMEAINALFPSRPERPKPPTMYDRLAEGMTEEERPRQVLAVPDPVVLFKERQPDELAPAFTRTWRVGLNDMPRLGWVIERMIARCPHLMPPACEGVLRGLMLEPACFFQMTDNAIASARFVHHDAIARPYVEVLFALHTDIGPEGGGIRGSQGEKDAIQLLRLIRDWGKLQGAVEVRRLNAVSDLSASILTKDLQNAARRDEVWLPL